MERRKIKHPRIGPLLIRTSFRFGETSHKGYVTNLSLGGAFLATEEHIPIGHRVELVIFLPWRLGKLEVDATVIWRRAEVGDRGKQAPGMGIQFIDLNDEAIALLKSYARRFYDLAAQLPDQVS